MNHTEIDGEIYCVNMNRVVTDGVILCKYEPHRNRRSYIVYIRTVKK